MFRHMIDAFILAAVIIAQDTTAVTVEAKAVDMTQQSSTKVSPIRSVFHAFEDGSIVTYFINSENRVNKQKTSRNGSTSTTEVTLMSLSNIGEIYKNQQNLTSPANKWVYVTEIFQTIEGKIVLATADFDLIQTMPIGRRMMSSFTTNLTEILPDMVVSERSWVAYSKEEITERRLTVVRLPGLPHGTVDGELKFDNWYYVVFLGETMYLMDRRGDYVLHFFAAKLSLKFTEGNGKGIDSAYWLMKRKSGGYSGTAKYIPTKTLRLFCGAHYLDYDWITAKFGDQPQLISSLGLFK
jgi:hypothetical protein